MWALTLKQPWAWMVLYGTKDIENRGWCNRITRELEKTAKLFAIHAGVGMTKAYYDAAVAFAREEDPDLDVPSPETLVFGAIVGVAQIGKIYSKESYGRKGSEKYVRWRMPEQHGWELSYRAPLPHPLYMKGAQQFWSVPDHVVTAGKSLSSLSALRQAPSLREQRA